MKTNQGPVAVLLLSLRIFLAFCPLSHKSYTKIFSERERERGDWERDNVCEVKLEDRKDFVLHFFLFFIGR